MNKNIKYTYLFIVTVLVMMLLGCSKNDDTPFKPDVPDTPVTYTFTAGIGEVSRVSYDYDKAIKCKWEESDKGKTVSLKDGKNTYEFTISEVKDGVATLTYSSKEKIENESNFDGYFEYSPAPAQSTVVQTANGSTEHMKYGDLLKAPVKGYWKTLKEVKFSHDVAFFRFYFTVNAIPKNTTGNPMFAVSGPWKEEQKVEFQGLEENKEYVLYMTAPSAKIEQGKWLSVSVSFKRDADYVKAYDLSKKAPQGGIKYEAQKLYNTKVDFPTDEMNGHKYVDLGIRCDKDGNVNYDNNGLYRLVFATRNIGAEADDAPGYYFRWGELNGWKVTAKDGSGFIAEQQPCVKNGTYANGKGETWDVNTFGMGWQLYDKYTTLDIDGLQNWCTKGITLPNEYNVGDAATYNWGKPWRTFKFYGAQYEVLFDGSDYDKPLLEIEGMTIKPKDKSISASIVVPQTGYCEGSELKDKNTGYFWTSKTNPSSDNVRYAHGLNFPEQNESFFIDINNYRAQPIRPIAVIW